MSPGEVPSRLDHCPETAVLTERRQAFSKGSQHKCLPKKHRSSLGQETLSPARDRQHGPMKPLLAPKQGSARGSRTQHCIKPKLLLKVSDN